jgi:hypothetical protein
MSNYDIKVDLSPYLPDTYLKEKLYQSMDKVDYTTYIGINSTIFVFNINCSSNEYQYYNDPGYLLYGIKKKISTNPTVYFDYKVPPTYYFNYPLTRTDFFTPYTIVESIDYPNEVINNLIMSIGYNPNLIDLDIQTSPYKVLNFSYKVLNCTNIISKNVRQVVYLFFNIKNLTKINYNNYNSVTYYNLKYNNIFIYPFINTNPKIPILSLNKNLVLAYDKNDYLSTSTKYIDPIDFDDREIIKYFEKIDYKYMERKSNYLSQENKIELLISLSKNYKLFENFFTNSQNSNNSIMITNNEISKVYFGNEDWENKNLNSYTMSKLNNNYVNNNLSFSGKEKSYSFTLNGKLSYVIKQFDVSKFRYSPYNYSVINAPSIYQLSKNYYTNTYINFSSSKRPDLKANILYETNCLLFKIFITIDSYLIDLIYLTSSTVSTSITSLFSDCNELIFGKGADKLNLYFVNKIKNTQTYYIDKYKIQLSFIANGIVQNYYVILGLCIYNGDNLNIINIDKTKNTDDLSYILFTNEDCSISLNPQIYNLTNEVNIYENNEIINLLDIKNYNMLVTYNNNDNFKDIIFSNYYTFIPLIKPTFSNNYIDDIYKNNDIANLFDVNISKINNFIKNLINLSNNIINLLQNSILLNFLNTLVYDSNLELIKYIKNYNYFPKIKLNSFLPNTINKYKLYHDIPKTDFSLIQIPAGNYKLFKYKNFYPEFNFSETSEANDQIAMTINNINAYLKNNFVVLILLPNNLVPDDKFIVDLELENKENYLYKTNYSFNIGPEETKIFLVVSDEDGNPYVNSQNIIYGYELFNQFNTDSGTNKTGYDYKIRLNLFFSTYLNFYQMVFLTTIFKYYSDNKNSIIDLSNTNLQLHNKDLLKDIVYYDFIRFNYPTDLNKIKQEYTNYNSAITNTLYYNKYFLNLLKTDISRLIFILNTNKIVMSLNKIFYYLSNYLLLQKRNQIFLNIVNYLGKLCLNITLINYNQGTTFSINNNYYQNLFLELSNITIETSYENINNLITSVKFTILYFQDKILLTKTNILTDCEIVKNSIHASQYIKIQYIKLFDEVTKYELNELIYDKLFLDINNLITEDLYNLLNELYPTLDKYYIKMLANVIVNYLHLILLNSKKIDELFNTVRIVYDDNTIDSIYPDGLTNKVVKNMFVYNTTYYNSLDINNFNITVFLSDYLTTITYLSNQINNPTTYLYYEKSLNENIAGYINNTIKYFDLINEQIIGIYKYDYNINVGVLPKINIMEIPNVSKIYYLLTVFKDNFTKMESIVSANKIDLFEEFVLVVEFFNNYIGSIEDFLFYIEIRIYFTNLNTFNVDIFSDILKIIEIKEFYTLINNLIKLIIEISNGNTVAINNIVTTAYENLSKYTLDLKNPNTEFNDFKSILKNFKFGNKNIYNILKNYILNSYIIINNIPNLDNIVKNITFQGQQIVIIRDYNLLYQYLSNSSFNFNPDVLVIVNDSITNQIDILNYYYDNDFEFYKQLINYNYLDIKNITINITNNEIVF